ncbi:BEN domain-containing protein 6-like isoform X2 [Ptychodera flava]|uniref:BEN domain-containing protein 6-like isoform X2 n=1 Tax=Ptychodera flava TaxID=63121 RepID=UPI00396A6EDA
MVSEYTPSTTAVIGAIKPLAVHTYSDRVHLQISATHARTMTRFALYDFYDEAAVEVGETKWMEDVDGYDLRCDVFDYDKEVIVRWPAKGRRGGKITRCAAKVLKLSDNRAELVQLMNHLIKEGFCGKPVLRDKRKTKMKKRLISDSESDEDRVKVSVFDQCEDCDIFLNRTRSREEDHGLSTSTPGQHENASSQNEEILRLQRELEEKERENQALRNALTSLHWLPEILPRLERFVNSTCEEDKSVTPAKEFINISDKDVCLGEGITIKQTTLARISSHDYKKCTRELLTALFNRRTLATHSFTGKPSNVMKGGHVKPQLEPRTVNAIIDYVITKFNVPAKDVVDAIKSKLNCESKLYGRGKSVLV